MQRPEAADARRQLVDIIGGAVYHALGLKETLEEERRALAEQDLERLQAALDTKSQCVAKLHDAEKHRLELCAAAGFEAGAEQMRNMLAWCDEADVVENCWSHLMDIAVVCHSINDTNGAIILGRKQQIENTLTVVRGGAPDEEIYDFRGREARDNAVRSIAQV